MKRKQASADYSVQNSIAFRAVVKAFTTNSNRFCHQWQMVLPSMANGFTTDGKWLFHRWYTPTHQDPLSGIKRLASKYINTCRVFCVSPLF